MKIPFNLHDALDGKPVINGKGEDFLFEAYYPGLTHPIAGNIRGKRFRFTKTGQDDIYEISETLDLFMKQEKITRWILVSNCVGFDTKEKAVKFYGTNSIRRVEAPLSIVKIEFYPGEGFE